MIVGGLSGPLFVFFNYILIRCGIDDPLDAIPVHGAGGVFGTIAVYIFKEDGLITGGFLSKDGNENLNYPFHALNGLLWNIIGLIAIIAWTGVTCFIMFSILAKLKMLRVETEQEFKGGYLFLCGNKTEFRLLMDRIVILEPYCYCSYNILQIFVFSEYKRFYYLKSF